ncbi:MAG: hypothetical protein M3458_05965 [Acidobacteriota bacterium]|nr:hypothetical protein [Acidobacteriota bacterium]
MATTSHFRPTSPKSWSVRRLMRRSCAPFEIGTTNDLQTRLPQHAMIPAAVCLQLEQERAQSPELTTLQREMHALMQHMVNR